MVDSKIVRSMMQNESYFCILVVVVSSPHQSPRCGVSRFRSALSIAIPLSVWSASISPAH